MKKYLFAIPLFIGSPSFAQSIVENELLKLSENIFQWEVENNIDSLEKVFHEKFMVIGSDGNSQLKNEYLGRLKSGSFVHNNIKLETDTTIVAGNTAIVSGKGKFSVTVSGKTVELYLSYMEVFTKESNKENWQVIAMKANVLDK